MQPAHRPAPGSRDVLMVGRTAAMDVSLPFDPEVSRIHCRIQRAGSEWTVVDDGLSRNGTSLNQIPLNGRKPLRHGDEIRVGSSPIVFRAPLDRTSDITEARARSDLEITPAQRRVLLALCCPFRSGERFATPASNQEIAASLHLDGRDRQGAPARAVQGAERRGPHT